MLQKRVDFRSENEVIFGEAADRVGGEGNRDAAVIMKEDIGMVILRLGDLRDLIDEVDCLREFFEDKRPRDQRSIRNRVPLGRLRDRMHHLLRSERLCIPLAGLTLLLREARHTM